MTYQANPTFPHRHNKNGVIDSICSECLVTVASARDEDELRRLEQAHVCSPVRLYQLGSDPGRRFLLSGNRGAV
jgi:hypothetical protein